MNNKTKTIIGIGVLALFIAVAVFAYNSLSERWRPETPVSIEDTPADDVADDVSEEEETVAALDFTAYDNDGNAVKLSDYFGKPIVLNFWASWCPPCKSEMPHFDEVYNELKDDVLFLMVDLVDGAQETEAKGKKYIADNGFTFPVLFDLDSDAAYTYAIRSIPTTIFIDKDGNIAAGVKGSIDEETLRKGIDMITKPTTA